MRGLMIAVWAGLGMAACGYMCSYADKTPPTTDASATTTDTATDGQTAMAHIICQAIRNTPDGLTCTVDVAQHAMHARLLRTPVGSHTAWCDGYRETIRSSGLRMSGWVIHTYDHKQETPEFSCPL